MQEALLPLITAGLVRLEMPNDGRFATLQQWLRDYQPHLLFLSGHGQFFEKPHTGAAPYGTFLFEGEQGGMESVADSQLAAIFSGSAVRCVVLSACESAQSASTALNCGLSRQLACAGIPHVIGMRESLLDRAGILFSRLFCTAIARKERVDVALQEARQGIIKPLAGETLREFDAGGATELSLGQWCLPQLISQDAAAPLVDWDFTPCVAEQLLINQTMHMIILPPRFLGRRPELRRLEARLRKGGLQQLLITGPGGQGKTALAGKLAQELAAQGYQILAWCAKQAWEDFLFELQFLLNKDNAEKYERMLPACKSEEQTAGLLLRLLLYQAKGKKVLFFDNLESLQHPATRELTDKQILAWITAARALSSQGLILLLTSRWELPGWPDADHLPLVHTSYGDFLQMARQQQLPLDFIRNRDRLHRIHAALHGNGRGLTFFAAAIKGMNAPEEECFLEKLAAAQAEIQADMAIATIYSHLDAAAQELLLRLTVYSTPVPVEGVIKLGLDLAEPPEELLHTLLAVALVEQPYNATWQTLEFQCNGLAADWLVRQGLPAPGQALQEAAADYQLYLFAYERNTFEQAVIVHRALHTAGRTEQANSLALDSIVGWLNRAGLYRTLLREWLPAICLSGDQKIRAQVLNQTGKQHIHLGEYVQALRYLEQSLAIRKEIGDAAGLCATLFNMGHIYWQNKQHEQALATWAQVYSLAKRINLAQALQALEGLAKQRRLPGGMEGWERLAEKMGKE